MKIFSLMLLVFSALSPLSAFSYDSKGPWTKVQQIYSKASDNAPFVYFDAGAMPGCYDDRGAYLPISELTYSDKAYSTILAALIADRSVQVFYNYKNTTEGYAGWSLCEIEAVYIR